MGARRNVTVIRLCVPDVLLDTGSRSFCSFLLISQSALQKVLRGNPGILKQGFWWEFVARCVAANLRITELPVAHRARAAGETQVYRPTKVPRIAFEHLMGLFALRKELAELSDRK